jgi:predicted AAA+ superfamily ATPase
MAHKIEKLSRALRHMKTVSAKLKELQREVDNTISSLVEEKRDLCGQQAREVKEARKIVKEDENEDVELIRQNTEE